MITKLDLIDQHKKKVKNILGSYKKELNHFNGICHVTNKVKFCSFCTKNKSFLMQHHYGIAHQ